MNPFASFHKKHPAVRITTTLSITVGGIPMDAITLNVGQSTKITLVPLKADGTPSGGKLSNQSIHFDDNPYISFANNPDGTSTVVGLAPSGGTIMGLANSTVTDTDGFLIQSIEKPFTVTVNPDPDFADRTTAIDLTATNPA